MESLNAPFAAETTNDLLDVLWHLSAWALSQANAPALASPDMADIRTRLKDMSGELQALQADIGLIIFKRG